MAANLKSMKRRFVRLSSQATITQLKKFIAKKILDGMEKYRDVRKMISLILSFIVMFFLICC